MLLEDLNLKLVVDSHYGVYAGECLLKRMGSYLNLSEEDRSQLSNKESEYYWEVFEEALMQNVTIEDKEYSFFRNEDGDIFLCLAEELRLFYESEDSIELS